MKNKLNIVLISLFVAVFVSIFYRWFFGGEIIGGDWPYLFKESLENYYFLVPSWNTWQGNGLGGTNPVYFLQSFEYLTVFLAKTLHISWPVVYKIFWFGLFIGLSISASIYLLKTIFSQAKLWQMGAAALTFATNTYILMVVGGGQMGIALAYSVAPLVLARFIVVINNLQKKLEIGNCPPASDFVQASRYKTWRCRRRSRAGKLEILRKSGVAGLALSLQVLFDPRIAYITMIAVVMYMVLNIKRNILNTFSLILYTFIIPGLVTVLLHIFWILPLLFFSQTLYERFPDSYTNVGIVKFLSFSAFSQSMSLLHSNWPENIFGKVYFMRSEFILISILAFSSLLFLGNSTIKQFNNKAILFFALLGLLGSFLAKGANHPFGEIYLWLFENIPGFEMFRDPTKFYLLVSLAYSVLIPFSIYSIYRWLNSKFQPSPRLRPASKIQKYLHVILLVFFIVYWTILIHPALIGQLRGTFKKHEAPKEYIDLKDFLYKQPEFFRTLWVPRQHRFTFFSNSHPSVESGPLFNATSAAESIRELKKAGAQEYLSELSIKYIIVPYDSLEEFFLTDRKYDSSIPEKISKSLEDIVWLKKIDGLGNIAIFQISSPKDHLRLEKSGKISYKMISPTRYIINASSIHSQKLIFSEKYNPSWVAKVGDTTIKSQKTSDSLNSFALEKGNHNFEIVFLQDKVYGYTRTISLAAFLGILFFILKYKKSSSLSN